MRVEIWSDVVCPWCYIGKRRFEQALAGYEHADTVDIVYRPYQLDPTAPPGASMPVREAYARKFGGWERADQIIEHLTGVAAADGLDFHLDRALRSNTLLAHRLLWAAEHTGAAGLQSDLKERLLRAYFVDGDTIGDPDTLEQIALDAGLDPDTVAAVLHGDLGRAEVHAQLDEAHDLGITAVPTFVFDGKWTVPGAQDPEVFLTVLRRVETLTAAESTGSTEADAACNDDACEV